MNPANGARRRTDKISGTRLFWTALSSRISSARHNMEFLFVSAGGRDPELASICHFVTPTAGYLHGFITNANIC